MRVFGLFFFWMVACQIPTDLEAQPPELPVLSLAGIGGVASDAIMVTGSDDTDITLVIGSNSAFGTGNIDSYCSLGGERNIFFAVNSSLHDTWSKCYSSIGDSSYDYYFPLHSGSAIVAGIFNSGWGFFIGKEDASGTLLWQKNYSRDNGAILLNAVATDDGGYIFSGRCSYTDSNFTIHYGTFLHPDIFVLKVDSAGNKLWAKVIGGSGDEDLFSVTKGPNGGCYVVGSTTSTDFDCIGNKGGRDGFVVRLDINGNILWHRDIGGAGDDGLHGNAIESLSGVIVALGSNSSDGDLHHHKGGFDYWVCEIDSSGNIEWENCYGSALFDEFPMSVCKSSDGSIWVMGESFGKGEDVDTSFGNGDAWLVHLDNVGRLVNAKVLGSSMADQGTGVRQMQNGDILAVGIYSQNDGTFDSLVWYGSTDAFLAVCPALASAEPVIASKKSLTVFPNPISNVINVVLGKPNEGSESVGVYSPTGACFYNSEIGQNLDHLQIDVTAWPSGLYFLKANSSTNTTSVFKILKL